MHRSILLALLFGLLGGLGHAPFGLWPVALAGFAGLIWVVARAARPGRVAWTGGAAYFGVTLHWIVEPFLVEPELHGWMAPFALILLAGGLALFWGLAGWLTKHMQGPRAVMFALALAGAEAVRGHIFTGFPWALPGYIWVDTPVRLSVTLVGSHGLTALTLLAASLPAAFAGSRARLAGASAAALALLGGLAVPGVLPPPPPAGDLGTVRLVQSSIEQKDKWDPDLIQGQFRDKLALTRGDGSVPDLVVWPESALAWPLDVAQPALEAIGAAGRAPFVTGLNRRQDGAWFNSLAVADASGSVTETFDKVHLVPFGEYIPFRLGFVRALAARDNFGYTPGALVHTVETPLGAALPLICYEGIFPGHVFRADTRADYLLLITNDAWFGTFAGPEQHFDQARFRAAEHGLSLVRVANRGVTAVIGPRGDVAPGARLEPDRPATLDAAVPRSPGVTLYARTGDAPVFALLLLAVLGALVLGARNRVAKPAGLE